MCIYESCLIKTKLLNMDAVKSNYLIYAWMSLRFDKDFKKYIGFFNLKFILQIYILYYSSSSRKLYTMSSILFTSLISPQLGLNLHSTV